MAEKLLRIFVLVLVCWYSFAFGWTALGRMSYPFELEIIESSLLAQVERINANQPVYTQPSIEYTPLIYTPGFFYLAAPLSKLFAPDSFAPLRLLATLGTIACVLLIAKLVHRETGNYFSATFAAGLYFWTAGAQLPLCFSQVLPGNAE